MIAEERIATAFLTEHPDEAARVLERIDAADAAALLASVPPRAAGAVIRALGPPAATACVAALDDAALAPILEHIPLSLAAWLLRGMDADRRDAVLALVDAKHASQLRSLLAYPDASAGALADPLTLAVPDDLTVAEAQKQLRSSPQHLLTYVYVVSRDRTLVGVLAVAELMAARGSEHLAAVMRHNPVRLDAQADLVTIGAHPAWQDYDALPVVDMTGRFIGAIRHKTIRRLATIRAQPMMNTIVGLSELYWVSLAGLLATIAPQRGADAQGGSHVS